ncbi:sulfite exporter TauE/SafE family protein [Stappia taiwanensis]|uniref:Probable membrane transporter protein n=1 Tax=Stappia taiwanensis TaxID=992267 RepID=A0A838Y1C5_9HYPH|nr:sulfite exporter TauE/SafE family protein [Stappia taiwanensis]MBA4612843.1 sulfite exporter TauE/SafE family protein [Stappia taiwanensis]GGE89570.1 UPF0721 transmembrane protein [Stappia taiwanensis]
MLSWMVIVAAGFLAGCLNALAGGGTFLTFPALVWFGLPPVMANATATVAALPGYIGAAHAFRASLRAEGALGLRAYLLVAALGGVIGALLLLVTPSSVFSGIVPWMLLLATVLFAAGPRLVVILRRGDRPGPGRAVTLMAMLAVCIYGGYFNGGLGILLLAAFGLVGFHDLNGMNGLKNLLSAILSLLSVMTFAIGGIVSWPEALVMSVAALTGGYAGAWAARHWLSPGAIRWFVIFVGVVMTALFFWKGA